MSGDDRQNSPSISRQNRPSATEECEEKLKALIIEMKTELAELKRQKAEGTLPPQAPEGKKGPKKTKENK